MEENKQLIRQSNVLTESRYDFDPIEKRCIYTIIQKVRKDYVEGQRSLFDNMLVHLQPSALLQIVDAKAYQASERCIKQTAQEDIEIENDNMWLICGFINWAKFEKRKERVDGRGIFTNNAVPSRTRCQIYRVFPYCGNFPQI